ncbi:MAG: 2-oxoacid:acceptor oxidoreductase family protein [Conexivisphaera sp.]
MRASVLLSGRGGQGIVEAGNLLALSFMRAGMWATAVPTYGPQTRGGRVESAVVASEDPVDDPLPRLYSSVVLADPLALRRIDRLQPGGLLIVNVSLIDPPRVPGARVVAVDATRIAERAGAAVREPRVLTGIALLGALSGAGAVPREWLVEAARSRFRDPQLLEANLEALSAGAVAIHLS